MKRTLGITFQLFAYVMLTCVLTCWRAPVAIWNTTDPTHQFSIRRELSLESGRVRSYRYWTEASAAELSRQDVQFHLIFRIPEPLGYQTTLLEAMFAIRKNHWLLNRRSSASSLTIPLWPLTFLTLIPALRFARIKYHERLTRRRLRRGCCAMCGYDLRASTGLCPECGEERHAAAIV